MPKLKKFYKNSNILKVSTYNIVSNKLINKGVDSMSKAQIEMEIKKVFNQMQITLDNAEWVRLHQQYLQLKKQLEN